MTAKWAGDYGSPRGARRLLWPPTHGRSWEWSRSCSDEIIPSANQQLCPVAAEQAADVTYRALSCATGAKFRTSVSNE